MNVALAKLGFVGALALMGTGAVSVRLADNRELREMQELRELPPACTE